MIEIKAVIDYRKVSAVTGISRDQEELISATLSNCGAQCVCFQLWAEKNQCIPIIAQVEPRFLKAIKSFAFVTNVQPTL
jgi:hypothetical protein